MRRSTTVRGGIAAAVILAIGLGGLAACSGGGDTPPTPTPGTTSTGTATVSPADAEALAQVDVAGGPGATATITLPSTPFTVGADVARLVSDGTGDTVAAGELLELNSSWFSGADGSSLGSTYDQSGPEALVLADSDLPPALIDALVGTKIGARVLVALNQSNSTTLAVVDVMDAQQIPDRAQGSAVTPPNGLPAVALDDSGKPTLTAATGAAPTALVAQPLIQGSGPAVTAGQTLVVKYTGWLWDGTQFDSSWDRGETFSVPNIGQASVIDGWNQGLVGQNVGSQVLLVVPPDLGYKDQEQGSIPANSTLVFVVDILAAA